MQIRTFQPGDEQVQAEIYNTAAGPLPAFKPATPEEIARRYRTTDSDPTAKFYAVEGGRVVGYAVFNANGRISYPWCLPQAQDARAPLLESVVSAICQRGAREAWAAYRADWIPVITFFQQNGFVEGRKMVNYVAELSRLPRTPVPAGQAIAPLERTEVPEVQELGRDILPGDPSVLERVYWENPYFNSIALLALKDAGSRRLLGAAVAIINAKYADPTKLDAAMPCFRLGTMGTEAERHKRVNGLFSCVFDSDQAGEVLLAEAARRFERAGLTHVASQAPSDQPALCAFYDRFFARQGAFPILARRLDPSG